MDAHDENASPLRSQPVKRLSTLSPFSAASPQHRRPNKQLKEKNYNRYEADPNIEMTLCEETTLLEQSCLSQNQTLEVLPEESEKTLETVPSLADELGALSNGQDETIHESTEAPTLAEELGALDQKTERELVLESREMEEKEGETTVTEEVSGGSNELQETISQDDEGDQTSKNVEDETDQKTLKEQDVVITPVEEPEVQEETAETHPVVDLPVAVDEEEQADETSEEKSVHETLEGQKDLLSCEDELKDTTDIEAVEQKERSSETKEMDESVQDEETINVDATLEVSFGFGMDSTQANNTLQQVCVELVETVEENLLIEGSQIVTTVVEEITVFETVTNEMSEKAVIIFEGETATVEEDTNADSFSTKMEESQEDFLSAIITSELDQNPASCFSPIVGSQLEPIPESPDRQPTSSVPAPRSQNDTSLLAQRKPNLSESLIDFVLTEKKVEYEMETAEATKEMEKRMKILEQELGVLKKERDDYQFLFESTGQKNKTELTALRQRCHELESEVEILQQKQFNESQMVNLHDLGERLDLMMKESEAQAEVRENLTKELKEANEKLDEQRETVRKLEEEQKQTLLNSLTQIESLTQQTEELSKLTEDLKEKNRLLEESEFQSVEMVEALKQDLENETKEHEELTEKYRKLESDMELLVINQEDLKDRDGQALSQLKTKKEELSVLVEELKLKVMGLEEGLTKAEDSFQITLAEQEKKKVELEEEIKTKVSELSSVQENLEMSKADLQTVVDDLDQTVIELTGLKQEFEEYKSQKERLTSDLETRLQSTIDRLVSEKDQLEIEKKTLNDRIEELEKAQKDSQAEDQARQSLEMDKMAEELQAKTAELIEAQASLELTEARLTELQVNVLELEKRIEQFGKTTEEFEEYKTSAELNKTQLVTEKEQLEKEKIELSERVGHLEQVSQRVKELETVEVKLLDQILSLEKMNAEERAGEESWKQKMIDMQDLHSEEVGRVVKEKNEFSQRCQKLEQEVQHRADSLQQAQSQIDSLNVALKESLEQKEIIETRMANLQMSMDASQKSLMQTIQALGEKMDSRMSKADTGEMEKDLKETKEQLVEWRRVAEERLETVNGQNKEIDEYQQQINQAQSQIDQLRSELSSLRTKNEELNSIVVTLTQKAAQLEDFRLQNEGFSTAAGDSEKLQKRIEALEADLLKKTKDAEKAWTMCDDMDELEENYKKQLSEQSEEIQRLKEKCGEAVATGGLLNVLRPDNLQRLTPGSVNNSRDDSVASAKEVFASPAQEKTYLGQTDKTQFEHEAKSPVKTNASCRQQ